MEKNPRSRARIRRRPRGGAKYPQVRAQIREQIVDGALPPGTRLPGETEFAKRLNVNRMTVSRALQDLAAEGLVVQRRGSGTYVADPEAPPFLPGRNARIGVLWWTSVLPADIASRFVWNITQGVLDAWQIEPASGEFLPRGPDEVTHGIWRHAARRLEVQCVGEAWSSKERHPPLEAVRAAGFDGLITLGIVEEDWLDELLNLGLPTVIVDFPNERFGERADHVFVDPVNAYRAGVRHLADRGLRNIHFVGSLQWEPAPNVEMSHAEWKRFRDGRTRVEPDSFLRLGAYRQAMDACGLPAPESRVHFCEPNAEARDAFARKLLALPEGERPEAVVCHAASQAEYLIETFAARGFALEGVGATESEHLGAALPLKVDPQRLGATAASLLYWRLQQPDRPYLNVGERMTFEAPVRELSSKS